MNFAYFYGFLHQIYFDFTSSHMGYGPLILVCGDRHVASAENPRDGPEDVPSEAFRGHPAVGPGDSLLEVASREQQVLMRSRPSKLRLQSSHAQNVDVAMQGRGNLSLATLRCFVLCFLKDHSVLVRCSGTVHISVQMKASLGNTQMISKISRSYSFTSSCNQ